RSCSSAARSRRKTSVRRPFPRPSRSHRPSRADADRPRWGRRGLRGGPTGSEAAGTGGEAMTDAADSGPIRVLLVDDHGVVRRGLRGYLELLDDIEVIGEAENGLEGVELSAELTPDVILMDIVMPQLDGIGAITQIKTAQPAVQVVALTSFIEEDKVLAALEA